jgi:hypothetical protein
MATSAMVASPICSCSETDRQPHCQPALERVADQGGNRRALVAASQHIGGARVFRAIGARIGQAEQLAADNGKRDRADQVSGYGHPNSIHLFLSYCYGHKGSRRIYTAAPYSARAQCTGWH